MAGSSGSVIEAADTRPWGAVWRARLPARAAGRWVSLAVRAPALCWVKLELTDAARGHVVREAFLRRRAGPGGTARFTTLLHVPSEAGALDLLVFGAAPAPGAVTARVLSRVGAALRLLASGWRALPAALRGEARGVLGRARALLGQAPARAGTVPGYADWIALFEAPEPPPPDAPDFPVVILGEGDDAATRAALPPGMTVLAVQREEDWVRVPAGRALLVGAGEVPHPHAGAWFARAARATDAVVAADCDVLGPDGRAFPLLKPGADASYAASGLFATGAVLAWLDGEALAPAAARQVLVTRARDALAHVPRVLTHLPAAPRPVAPAASRVAVPREVTALVPSTLRSAHSLACLRRVAGSVPPPRLRMVVALSAPEQADPALARGIQGLPGAEILPCPMPVFNFAAVTNAAAAAADTPFLLLLNDDVAPLRPDWLEAMLAEMADPRVGIVGARLRYGNGMIQHEGVALGLGGLAEHIGRLRPAGDDGPYGIGAITRQVAAVTAACLLVRTDLFRALGGMDTGFAIALNDVDLCLRARAAGARVIYCAEAELTHYESLSLGRHYAGARAGLEAVEVAALRARWAALIAADPFGNPQASRAPGAEFQPGFPPGGPGFPALASDFA